MKAKWSWILAGSAVMGSLVMMAVLSCQSKSTNPSQLVDLGVVPAISVPSDHNIRHPIEGIRVDGTNENPTFGYVVPGTIDTACCWHSLSEAQQAADAQSKKF